MRCLSTVDVELVKTVGFISGTRSTNMLNVSSYISWIASCRTCTLESLPVRTRNTQVLLDLTNQVTRSTCVNEGQFKTPAALTARLPSVSTEASPPNSPRETVAAVKKPSHSPCVSLVHCSSFRSENDCPCVSLLA